MILNTDKWSTLYTFTFIWCGMCDKIALCALNMGVTHSNACVFVKKILQCLRETQRSFDLIFKNFQSCDCQSKFII